LDLVTLKKVAAAWQLMTSWLQSFAYKTGNPLRMFVLAGMLSVFIGVAIAWFTLESCNSFLLYRLNKEPIFLNRKKNFNQFK